MFAIYNNGSVQFRSTSDNLYNLNRIGEPLSSQDNHPEENYYNFDDLLDKKKENKNLQKAVKKYSDISTLHSDTKIYYIKDIMTKKFISVDSQATLWDAYHILKKKQISQVPIVTFGNHIINMISKKILLNLILDDVDNKESIMESKIDTISLPELITADPLSDIRKVAKVMINYKIDAIPVVNKNNIIIGIVSKTDIIDAISHIPNFKIWA